MTQSFRSYLAKAHYISSLANLFRAIELLAGVALVILASLPSMASADGVAQTPLHLIVAAILLLGGLIPVKLWSLHCILQPCILVGSLFGTWTMFSCFFSLYSCRISPLEAVVSLTFATAPVVILVDVWRNQCFDIEQVQAPTKPESRLAFRGCLVLTLLLALWCLFAR